jgi:diguanylate cyclase (GGDEF)-like protein
MEKESFDYSNEAMLVMGNDSKLKSTLLKQFSDIGLLSTFVSNGARALRRLTQEEYTFLLADMKVPGTDALEFIKQVTRDYPDLSVIAMTAQGDTEAYKYMDLINAGATDYIKKPFGLDELEAKVRKIIHERNLLKELNRLSITDSLTGLFNQRHFYSRLREEMTRASRQSHPLSLVLMDLDHFKAYNDTYGHLAGDEVLRNVGRIINGNIREGVDSGYRYGGDEFAIILIDADLKVATDIGKRIQHAFQSGNFTASMGYTKFAAGMSIEDFVAAADKNLYKAKLKIKGNSENG